MIHKIIRDGPMNIAEITREQFEQLDPELQRCIQNNGEYGYLRQGKVRCDWKRPRTDCPFYQEHGCGAYENLVRIIDEEDLVIQSFSGDETTVSFSGEKAIKLD